MRIILVSANCADAYIDIEREHRTLQKLTESFGHSLYTLPAAEMDDVRNVLSTSRRFTSFDVLHFCGHATQEDGLHLRGKNRRKAFLRDETLTTLLAGSTIRLVVLNACSSESLAVSLSEVVPSVIGTTRKVRDVAARKFTRDFYGSYLNDEDESSAFAHAIRQQKQSATPAYIHVRGRNLDIAMRTGRTLLRAEHGIRR